MVRKFLVGVLLLVLAASCSDETTQQVSTSTAPVTTTPLMTSATSVTTSSTTPSTTTASMVSEGAEVWDLLYIQDSLGFQVAELYGTLAVQALGVEVNVHDRAIGDLSAVSVLAWLRDEASVWTDLVRDAEIIVFFANPNGSGTTTDIGICISASPLEREPPAHYSDEDWRPYRDVLDEIYAEIWKLREAEPVVLRAVDFYNPAISDWRQAGIEPECTAALEAMNGTIREVAEANGATVVSVYDLFNSAEHDQDPREKGYIGPDGLHATAEGAAAIADALAAVGFESTATR